ncbi:MAG: GNAT family N-acetyltransferase, partial [Chloroflexi bacterium]|nr:GNAT family N-acetyltransferase [Chloroflexota bacterium]
MATGIFRKGQAKEEIENGNVILLETHEGRPIYLNWLNFREFSLDGVRLTLGPRRVHAYNVNTIPEFRNMGIHQTGIAYVNRLLKSRGIPTVVGEVDPGNVASVHVHKKAGHRVIGKIRTFRIRGRLRIAIVSPGPRGCLLGETGEPVPA